jgi:hypothetical protein
MSNHIALFLSDVTISPGGGEGRLRTPTGGPDPAHFDARDQKKLWVN